MTYSGFLQEILLFHFTTEAQSELGVSMKPEILKITVSKFCSSEIWLPFTGGIYNQKETKKVSRPFTPPLPKFYFIDAPKDTSLKLLIQTATALTLSTSYLQSFNA